MSGPVKDSVQGMVYDGCDSCPRCGQESHWCDDPDPVDDEDARIYPCFNCGEPLFPRDEYMLINRGVRWQRCYAKSGHGLLERAFAEAWDRENQGPRPYLGTLLSERKYLNDIVPVFTSYEEQRAAATVIQWLGTNVGLSFLSGVLGFPAPGPREIRDRMRAGEHCPFGLPRNAKSIPCREGCACAGELARPNLPEEA